MGIVTLDLDSKKGTVTLDESKLTATISKYQSAVRANHGVTSGKYYWELKVNNGGYNSAVYIGIVNEKFDTVDFVNTRYVYGGYNGNKILGDTSLTYGAKFTSGDIIGVCLDLDNKTISFAKNGVLQGVAFNDLPSMIKYYPVIGYGSNNDFCVVTANFGAMPFQYQELFESLGSGWQSYDGSQKNVTSFFLIKQDNQYYNIKPEFYTNGVYKPLLLADGETPNESDFLNKGFKNLNDVLIEYKEGSIKSSASDLEEGKMFSFNIDSEFKSINSIE